MGYATGAAAGRAASERAVVLHVEAVRSLKDEPALVLREDWTRAVELRDVEHHGFGASGCVDDLYGRERSWSAAATTSGRTGVRVQGAQL
jgi:hypothetical protein